MHLAVFKSSKFRDIRIYSESLIKEAERQWGDDPEFAGIVKVQYEVPGTVETVLTKEDEMN